MEFAILQSLGIIFVVVGHRGGINLLADWFPIYSFHMPLFIFISGYFYKKESENQYLNFFIKKIRKLVIPYFIWNFIYGLIAINLQKSEIIAYGIKFNFESLFIKPWQGGNQFGLNVAGWFVLALFLIQIIYTFIRKSFNIIKVNNEYIIMLFMIILGLLGVDLAYKGYKSGWYLTLIHILFGLPFYHLGYFYKEKLEERDTLSNWAYFLILFIVQFLLVKVTGGNTYLGMWDANFNNFKCNIFTPFITPLPGIMFWLRTSRILVPSLQNSKIIDYISRNTWTIMMHHQFVFFIINYCMLIIKNNMGKFNGFNNKKFRTYAWYGYAAFNNKNFLLFYVIAGIAIPLIIKYYLSKIIEFAKSKNNFRSYNLLR